MSIAKHIVIILVVFHMANMQTINIPYSTVEMTDFAYKQILKDIEKASILCNKPKFYKECNVSPYRLVGYETVGWYFIKAQNVCMPLWGLVDNNSCPENNRLPQTESECQYICLAKPCQVIQPNGTSTNRNGYCTLDEYCLIDILHGGDGDSVGYNPCAAQNLICCPHYSYQP